MPQTNTNLPRGLTSSLFYLNFHSTQPHSYSSTEIICQNLEKMRNIKYSEQAFIFHILAASWWWFDHNKKILGIFQDADDFCFKSTFFVDFIGVRFHCFYPTRVCIKRMPRLNAKLYIKLRKVNISLNLKVKCWIPFLTRKGFINDELFEYLVTQPALINKSAG